MPSATDPSKRLPAQKTIVETVSKSKMLSRHECTDYAEGVAYLGLTEGGFDFLYGVLPGMRTETIMACVPSSSIVGTDRTDDGVIDGLRTKTVVFGKNGKLDFLFTDGVRMTWNRGEPVEEPEAFSVALASGAVSNKSLWEGSEVGANLYVDGGRRDLTTVHGLYLIALDDGTMNNCLEVLLVNPTTDVVQAPIIIKGCRDFHPLLRGQTAKLELTVVEVFSEREWEKLPR